ncbi:MAG TPA: type II toxin-antitoxin system prevent-host-death family antitoxin [Acidimicrobiales bacterium]|nr:type II toxin-antitoxin system prevent-host-death family antitoxin [Acidimicrobiales bacterium]
MEPVTSEELRNDTRGVLKRMESGDEVTITVDGRPAAVRRPVASGRRWMAKATYVRLYAEQPADRGLLADLDDLRGHETTDDLRW